MGLYVEGGVSIPGAGSIGVSSDTTYFTGMTITQAGVLTKIAVGFLGQGTYTNKLKIAIIRDNGGTGYTYIGGAYTERLHFNATWHESTTAALLDWEGSYSFLTVEAGDIVICCQAQTSAGANQKRLGISSGSYDEFIASEVTGNTLYGDWSSAGGTPGVPEIELTISALGEFETDDVIGSISDAFTDNSIDKKWLTATDGAGSAVAETNNRIELTLGNVASAAAVVRPRYHLPLDRDITLSVEVSNFDYSVTASGTRTLALHVATTDGAFRWAMNLYSGAVSGAGYHGLYVWGYYSGGGAPSYWWQDAFTTTAGTFLIEIEAGSMFGLYDITISVYDATTTTWYNDIWTDTDVALTGDLTFALYADQAAAKSNTFYFDNFLETSPPANRDMEPECDCVDGAWCPETSDSEEISLFLGFDNSGGVRVLDQDGTGWNLYADDWESAAYTCEALSCTGDAAHDAGKTAVALSTGLEIIDNTTGEVEFEHDTAGSTYDDGS